MRWPWSRRRTNGAKQARQEADQRHRDAEDRGDEVARNVRAAKETVRRADRFAREVEQSWHLRRGST